MPDVVRFEGVGHALPPVVPFVAPENTKWVYETNVVLDEQSLEPRVEISKRDLDKEIQSYKDECGMAFVLRQIAAGRLSITDVADDGKGGADVLGMPETLNQACQLAQEAIALGKEEAAKLGLKSFTDEELTAYVNEQIKLAQEAKKAKDANSTNEEAK